MEDQTFLQLVQSLGRMGTDASKPRLTKMSRSVGSSRAFSVLTIGLSLGLGACSAGGTGASADGPGGTPGIGGFGTGGGFFGTGGAVGAGGAGTGGTGTGGISSAGGDTAGGGTTAAGGGPDAGAGGVYTYDPSVAFDWPEATVTAGSCKPGKYQGTFSGWYDADIIAGFPVPIAGNVNLTLAQSADGEFFQVTGGDISGLVYGFIPFSSGLTGTLNCKTLKLENGYMPHGKYTIIGVDYPYEGPLHADYDKLTNQFTNGKWRVGEPTWKEGDPDPKFGGFGDWTVTWMSP